MKLSQTFIPLPFTFDAERLEAETLALPPEAWMSHPSGFNGNSAVPLVSVGAANNQLFNGAMQTTPWLAECPYVAQVMSTFGEIFGRSRLMKLEPGAEVSPHVDGDYHWYTHVRIHVPVITNPGVIFYCGNDQMHMKAGDTWIFDTWQLHRVVNNSDQTRVHLVMDASGSSRFWNMVRSMEAYDHKSDHKDIQGVRHVPFEEGKSVSIQTENFNVPPIMGAGEMEALVTDLIEDFTGNPVNNPQMEAHYRNFLTDFAKDWRQVWHLHGYKESGWPHYQALARGLHGKIDQRNHGAVILKSNRASANLVILKRLVQPAMNVELLKDLV